MKTELVRPDASAAGFRFALIVSRWNSGFTSRLEVGAREALTGRGATKSDVSAFYVPGAFELPLAALIAAKTGSFDAVVALGVVIRGDTPHFDYVAGQAAAGLMQASMESGVPVMFGVITADSIDQVETRCGTGDENKGYEAALSAIEMIHAMRELKEQGAGKKVLPHVV